MKRLTAALAFACLAAAGAFAQQQNYGPAVDNSGASRVSPYPIVFAFPGGCTYGDVVTYALGTPGSNTYICGATRNWVAMGASGGGTISINGTSCATGSSCTVTSPDFSGAASPAPAFSATPTFSLAAVSNQSPLRIEPAAMTANVTAVTFSNVTAGAKFSIAWTQAASGGPYTVAYGGSTSNTCPVSYIASSITVQQFEVGNDGSTVKGVGCSGNNGVGMGSEIVAPGTPPSGQFACWGDSTDHSGYECKANSSANAFKLFLSSGDCNPVTGICTKTNGTAFSTFATETSLTAAQIPAVASVFNSGTITLPAGNAVLVGCTSTCSVPVPAPVAGYQICIKNNAGVSTAITLSALGSSAMYPKADDSGYGTAGTGTMVSTLATGNKVCLIGRDSTHYELGAVNAPANWTVD